MDEHTQNCNDGACENHYVDFSQAATTELKVNPVSQAVLDAVSKTIEGVHRRSFSDRNPELGKMARCHVCGRRHRKVQALYTHGPKDGVKKATKLVGYVTCVQQFKELHVEEDLETGEKTEVYATAAQTRKGVNGAAAFKGKRLKSHPNQNKLQFIERVRKLFGEGTFDPSSEEHKAALDIARKTASTQLHKEARKSAKKHRRQQDVSRRINRGLAPSGTR